MIGQNQAETETAMQTSFMNAAYTPRIYLITQIMMIIALLVAIPLGLLPALLGGLLIYQLVEFGARVLERVGVNPIMGKVILEFMYRAFCRAYK
jgi:hypothetical protein